MPRTTHHSANETPSSDQNIAKRNTPCRSSSILPFISLAISIAIGVSQFFVMQNQNEITEKYSRLDTYNAALSYRIDLEEDQPTTILYTPQDDESHNIEGPSITINPIHGAVSQVWAVAYFDGTFAAVMNLDMMESNVLESHDANTICWGLTNYSIPIFGTNESTGNTYGSLYIVIQDFQGTIYTNLITFEFSADKQRIVDYGVYDAVDLLLENNEESYNAAYIGSFDTRQLSEYQQFRQYLINLLPDIRVV